MSRHAARTVRRAPVLVVLAGALVAGGLADRAGGPAPTAAASADVVQPVPVAAPADAYSSSWFCAGAAGAASGGRSWVVVYNNSPRVENGTVSMVGSNGGTTSDAVRIRPGQSTGIAESLPDKSPYVGAEVDVDGSSAVYQVANGAPGQAAAPCATSGSPDWYFPAGQTRVNAAENIILFDPYPDGVVVDMSFATNDGSEQPQAFQGISVPAHGVVVVPLASHLRRRTSIATTVTARSGNVVAWEQQVITPPTADEPLVGTPAANALLADPAWPVPGVSLMLGAPSAGLSWVWPDGIAGDGIDEQYVIYNPGTTTAEVRLSVGLQQGSAEPFTLAVAPGQALPVTSELEPRIPPGEPHSASIVSTNGVPVVAVRTVSAQNGKASGPVPVLGIGSMLGERLAADRWIVVDVATDTSHEGEIVILNSGPRSVQATISGVVKGTESLPVAAGGRAVVPVTTATFSTGPIVVQADGPVYTEYNLYATGGGTGVSIASAIPAAGPAG